MLHCMGIKANLHMKYMEHHVHQQRWFGLLWFMVFNATFKNMSVISPWSVLLAEETRVPGDNHRPLASH